MIGGNGTTVGTVNYKPCKFGGGSELLAPGDHVDISGFNTNNREFTIDFYFTVPTTTTLNTRFHFIRTEPAIAGAGIIVFLYLDLRSGFTDEVGLYIWPNYSNNANLTTWVQGRVGATPPPITKGIPYHCRIIVDPDNASLIDRGRVYFNTVRINVDAPDFNSTVGADWVASASLDAMGVGGDGTTGFDGDRIIDNMKIFPGKNEDFSTRFTEGIGSQKRRAS
jgi:hypothetical protein